jgi:CelD/BcsL family acetyltransferase involved in cellulose biosynthesis
LTHSPVPARALARRFSDTGIVTLTILMIGDRRVAWSYGFQFQGGWSLYQTTFDTRCEENSPGCCLPAKIVIEASDMNTLRQVDLGLGSEDYKEWFANGTRQNFVRHTNKVYPAPLAREGEVSHRDQGEALPET